MLKLCDNPVETLTESLWKKWVSAGYTTQPNSLTWMEVNNLSKYYVQLCQKTGADYRDFDFETILDHTLNYYENKSLIDNTVGQPPEQNSDSALADLNSKLAKDYGITINKQLKPVSEAEAENKQLKAQIRELSASNKELTEKLSQPVAPQIITKEVIKEVPVEIIKQIPAYSSDVQYSQAELIEILSYLKQRDSATYKTRRVFTKTLTQLKSATGHLSRYRFSPPS